MKTMIKWSNQNMQITNQSADQIIGVSVREENGYTPVELLTSSLGLCIFITISRLFERDGITIKENEFTVSVEAFKALRGPSRIEELLVEVSFPAYLEEAYRNKLIHSAEKACTIGNTIKNGAKIMIRDGVIQSE
ncbi:OsmC family protein [Gracilibacillus xinjiangensis]|uniref:OsmC family protein n=1 Tax=Gracilibacillus xinjiangensis TaxID=1193282 RepID=A0ABV8WUX8_9BACI